MVLQIAAACGTYRVRESYYATDYTRTAAVEHISGGLQHAFCMHTMQVPEPPAGVVSPAPSAQLSPEQAAVVGAWHAAYTAPSEAAQDKAIRSKYAPTAVFEDHLVKVSMFDSSANMRRISESSYATIKTSSAEVAS